MVFENYSESYNQFSTFADSKWAVKLSKYGHFENTVCLKAFENLWVVNAFVD